MIEAQLVMELLETYRSLAIYQNEDQILPHQKKKASISLRQLESLALGRETDLYTANLLDQSLKQARKALLKKQI